MATNFLLITTSSLNINFAIKNSSYIFIITIITSKLLGRFYSLTFFTKLLRLTYLNIIAASFIIA